MTQAPSWEQQRWLRNQERLQKKLDCLMSLGQYAMRTPLGDDPHMPEVTPREVS